MSRPQQHRHLKRKDSIRFLVFLAFSSIQTSRKVFFASAMAVWLFIQNPAFRPHLPAGRLRLGFLPGDELDTCFVITYFNNPQLTENPPDARSLRR